MRPTLGVKLALVLVGVVLGSLAIVYLLVVPRLEHRLVEAKQDELARALGPLLRDLAETRSPIARQDLVTAHAAALNARVVLFDRYSSDRLRPINDSLLFGGEEDIGGDAVAREAAGEERPVAGRVARDGNEFAEVAVSMPSGYVVLLSAPLDGVIADVQLVRRSLVAAGLVALAVAAAAAYLAALGLTRRLRRLEAAADGIAAGDFEAPIEVRGEDEISELGRTFDSMRVRLADVDRVRREFIANASHELRTPIFSLGGFLELLAEEDLDGETRAEFLAETRAQVERLTRLATDLLDLSRLDAGQLRVAEGEADLAGAARTVVEEFRAVADATGHPLHVKTTDAVLATGDHERVVQIARILVENAIRHTEPGTPIEVETAAWDGHATLAVRDEGAGIAPAEQERVFQRFYRAEGGKASGSGLGLAIARELATRMGGGLTVASRVGETTFTLDLPAATAFPRENGRPAAAAAPRAG